MPVRSQRLRWMFALLAAAAPQPIKHTIYRRVFGWDIHPAARFGLSLIAVDHLSAAEGVIVSHLTVIKGCDEVRLGVRAIVGPLNWISSPPRSAGLFPYAPGRRPRLVLGDEAAITTRHILYCDDEVVIEPYAVLAGLIGGYLGWLFDQSENILAPIITHGLYDFLAFLFVAREYRNGQWNKAER